MSLSSTLDRSDVLQDTVVSSSDARRTALKGNRLRAYRICLPEILFAQFGNHNRIGLCIPIVNSQRLTLLVIVVLAGPSPSLGQNAQEIIQRSIEATNRDWAAEPQFDCSEEDRNVHGDKTYEDLMIDGSLYQHLVAVNGKPLPPSQQADEARKLRAVTEKREGENSEQRTERIAKYEADRKRDHELLGELVKAFEFSLAGEQQMEGHRVYVLQAKPKPGYRAPNKDSEALTGMNGKLWIDKGTFQWVKVEAHVTHPVSIEGFVARVEPGTRFELDKIPVTPDLWFPKRFSMSAQAKVLLLLHRRNWEVDTYSNYRKTRAMTSQDHNSPPRDLAGKESALASTMHYISRREGNSSRFDVTRQKGRTWRKTRLDPDPWPTR